MKVLVFKVDGLIENEAYRLLQNEIESNLKKGYVLLTNGLELIETVDMPLINIEENIGSNNYEEEDI